MPRTQPSDALTNVADSGRKPDGTGPPAGPVVVCGEECGADLVADRVADGAGLVVVPVGLVDGATLLVVEAAGLVAGAALLAVAAALLAVAGDVAEPGTELEFDPCPDPDEVQAASAISPAAMPSAARLLIAPRRRSRPRAPAL